MRPWRKAQTFFSLFSSLGRPCQTLHSQNNFQRKEQGWGEKCDKIRKAKPGVLDEVPELERKQPEVIIHLVLVERKNEKKYSQMAERCVILNNICI